jgi:protocatechuate 3,4-dioxygenase beta subunit
MKLTRRQLIKALAILPIPAAVLTMESLASIAGAAVLLNPTPELADDDDPTPPADEGPFFKPKSPKRSNLIEPGMKGEKVVVSGRILNRKGEPVPEALIDIWHADAEGNYDNDGYRCRGHLFAGKDGAYKFEAVLPGFYPGRTRHYHVRVQSANGPILTTQLFFPDEPRNSNDGIFKKVLLMKIKQDKDRKLASFDFVLNLG